MAKKFVRGITDIKNIEHQDFDTNNVNDLLSDGQHNYIHRKKGNSEEYHNLTNNLKTLQSDDTDLLTVTNYNNTTNSATIRPKHDSQKEQLLESTDNTILISHGENGTEETTSVDVNPAKVLEHENLLTGDGLDVVKNGNTSTLYLSSTNKPNGFQLKTLNTSIVYGSRFSDSPEPSSALQAGYLTLKVADDKKIQLFMRESSATSGLAIMSYRFVVNGVAGEWREMCIDNTNLQTLLAQKQNTLTSNTSIGVDGTGLMQLYSYEMSYSSTSQGSFEGSLNTYAKTVKKDTSLSGNPKLEYHFTAKLNAGHTSITIPLNNNDATYFRYILIKYGETSGSTQTAMINGLIFSLTGSNLTITRDSSTYNQVVSFSDIIDPSVSVQSSNQEQTE